MTQRAHVKDCKKFTYRFLCRVKNFLFCDTDNSETALNNRFPVNVSKNKKRVTSKLIPGALT